MVVLYNFLEQVMLERSLNVSFLVLIPKKPDAMEVKDFRTISLVGVMYKNISKVFANRLCMVVHSLILDKQSAVVKGRQILDSVLIAFECINSRLNSRASGVISKLDIEKAYYHVNWNFLMYLLRWYGFLEKWRRWIVWCISTVKFSILFNGVKFSILLNGTSVDFFRSTKGVHQVDPPSLLLFDIFIKSLCRILDAIAMLGQFLGFLVGNVAGTLLTVSHLIFANDTFIFCDVDSHHLATLCGILARFKVVSGLKINLLKSELVLIDIMPNIVELVEILGCRQSSLPLKYLGLPLGATHKEETIWNPILEKMERRLAGWKRIYLSKEA